MCNRGTERTLLHDRDASTLRTNAHNPLGAHKTRLSARRSRSSFSCRTNFAMRVSIPIVVGILLYRAWATAASAHHAPISTSDADPFTTVERHVLVSRTAAPTPAPTQVTDKTRFKSKQTVFVGVRWSFLVFPLLSLSFMAWVAQPRRCCCRSHDDIPNEIVVEEMSGCSVVGDKVTDVELQPVAHCFILDDADDVEISLQSDLTTESSSTMDYVRMTV